MIILLFLLCFILNCHRILLFSQILNLFICAILEHNHFTADKEIHYVRFSIINNKFIYQVLGIKQSDHLKKGQYLGLTDCCEGDLDSYLNLSASGNLWQ